MLSYLLKIFVDIKFSEQTPVHSSEGDEEDDGDVEFADTDNDMDIDKEIFAVEPDHFAELNRLPVLGDYVSNEFKLRSQSKFYVGQITKMKDDEEGYEVKFLRYRKCNTFVEPLVVLWFRALKDKKVSSHSRLILAI
ncbi:hypothetical protein JTB14_006549 [Gonioctena quinquepunctata]|nr:hypothetical protein JTB14_006549 [Gonioctena quinquepunctata]